MLQKTTFEEKFWEKWKRYISPKCPPFVEFFLNIFFFSCSVVNICIFHIKTVKLALLSNENCKVIICDSK